MTRLRIAVIAGDGIGPEVIAIGTSVVEAVASVSGAFTVDWTEFPWGSAYYAETGRMMDADALQRLRDFDAVYFGAVGWPTVPDHISLWGLRLAICQGLDLWANVRPVTFWPQVRGPLRDHHARDLSWVMVRENSEGEYSGIGGRNLGARGRGGEVAVESAMFTEAGCERIIRYAFELAGSRPVKRVTSVTKSNAQRYGMVLWDEVFQRVAAEYAEIESDSCLVDAMAARMVLDPERLSVVVASNLHADILSDLGSALAGSLGLGSSANLDPARRAPSMFEPVHGSAPDIAGRGIANPIGAVASAALMLAHLGFQDQARVIERAIAATTKAGVLPLDLGGSSTTTEVGNALISAICGSDRGPESRAPRVWLGPDRPTALLGPLQQAGVLSRSPADANVFVWTEGPDGIADLLHPDVAWVQVVSAGVEDWVSTETLDQARTWTNASGAFGARVAEHVLAMILAAAKNLPTAIRAHEWQDKLPSTILRGSTVGVVGAGDIGQATLALLAPFGVRRVAVTRSSRDVPEADVSLPADALDEVFEMSDFVVLAAPLTTATRAFIGTREMELLGPGGWLINVGRGGLVDTEAMVDALEHGRLGGACLDVTDPEPLPPDHPLWKLPNVLITPHIANPPATHFEALAPLVMQNLARFGRGDELVGVIDVTREY